MRKSVRRYLILLIGVLVVVFFAYKFRSSIALQGFHWSAVGGALRHAHVDLLLLSLAAIYGCFAVRALRWIRFSRTLYGTREGRFATHFWNVYAGTLMGFSCTFLLGRAGEPIRPVLIGKKESLPIASMFGVYVLERIFDMAATAVLAGAALLLWKRSASLGSAAHFLSEARSAGIILLTLLVVAIAFLIYFRFHGSAWLSRRLENSKWRSGWRQKAAVLLEGFGNGLQGIRKTSDLTVLILYTAIHWIGVVFVYLWVAHAFGGTLAEITFAGALLVLAFTMVGSAVQLPGVGGGAQLATFLVLTLIFGIKDEPAATMSIVVWLIGFAGCCIVGLPLLFHEGWSMGDLRRIAQEEERAGAALLLDEAGNNSGKPAVGRKSAISGDQGS
ncbi:MAG TPA: lysylphosphatidylglycerol synthase transmembrane domain-containing protein [Candidatus Acidoferrales bacterium]|nr:lysylphosphatidylglycerol synthase transmembrane domain-containing protein [Candidatus Acidoferrales bacterium]